MPEKQPNLLNRGGKMGRMIREKDWSATSLGPMAHWPDTLVSTVNLIIEIDFPIAICWGKDLITIYNDAYRPLLGNKPEALGRPFREVWSEAIDVTGPQISRALNGQPGFFKNAEFTLARYGEPEQAWFDYSFSPIRDADGKIKGMINMVVEVTGKIQARKELEKMNETLEKRVEKRTKTLEDYKNQLRILTYQLNKAKEQERHRIARLLHDHVGQMLDLSVIKLDQLNKEVSKDKISDEIEELKEIILVANKYTREFVNELKPPPIFEKENIVELLRWVARRMKKYGLEITLEDDGKPKPLSEEVHKILYQSIRELFFNVIKHAEVNEATLTLRRQTNKIQITVEDTGVGFGINGEKPSPTKEGGFGLFNVQERIDLLGGSLEIESQPGEGTKAILYAPLKGSSKSILSTDEESLQKGSTPWAIDYEQPNIYDPNQLTLPLDLDL
ncbi:ATP-binding protein [Aliifodinibius sp. S!AR15-10]|uniref:PAS domain-containing sensor histidine kinase n=1 Tax=Aliifodinibius sp. S!AR15-10 TaxID=2950437 RepID=UPI0028573DF2|nr:ATP-binding protein [Aliifodinibius sp. S!AR15-10]MDR8394551.1 ATP-binding protein [Aliifodinibius sp. S!AR15-10]